MKQRVFRLENGTLVRLNDVAVSTESKFEHFFLMGKPERKKVAEWYEMVKNNTTLKGWMYKYFLDSVKEALDYTDYDYYIATLEPSVVNRKLVYKEGLSALYGISQEQWKCLAAGYYADEEWQSTLATWEEGILFKAYRVAMGYCTIEFMCEIPEAEMPELPKEWAPYVTKRPYAIHELEKTGEREVAGFKDGINNTRELYMYSDKVSYAVYGGCYDEPAAPVDVFWSGNALGWADNGCMKIEKHLYFSKTRGVVAIRRKNSK